MGIKYLLTPLDGRLVEIFEGKEKRLLEVLQTVDWLRRVCEDIWFVLVGPVEGLCNGVSHSFECLRRP